MSLQIEISTSINHVAAYNLILDAMPRGNSYRGCLLLNSHRIIIKPPIKISILFLHELHRMFMHSFGRALEVDPYAHIRQGFIKVTIVSHVA